MLKSYLAHRSGHHYIPIGRLSSPGMSSSIVVKEEVILYCKELSEKTVSQKQETAENALPIQP